MSQDGAGPEDNRLAGRVRRYGAVGANLGAVAARIAGNRLLRRDASSAQQLAAALGGLKGPLVKVAQMLATIPGAVSGDYAVELAKLQSAAPPMGWPFVRRRMAAELGGNWQSKFAAFDREAAAAASLGQVHRARGHDGQVLAAKLQYPEMRSAVEADLNQLKMIFAIHRRMDPAVLTDDVAVEIGERLREELDYAREAQHMALYRAMLAGNADIQVPQVVANLSTTRLLTMNWLEGRGLLEFATAELAARNRIGQCLFYAWWHPFSSFGVIHGDPHMGNYTIRSSGAKIEGINLLDFGCVRLFAPKFVGGVADLYHGLLHDRRDQVVHAYETWGFKGLSKELIDVLNIWARFIYGPMLEDRVRSIADGVKPEHYGRRQAFEVHRHLRELGPVKIPREFVFMDRAAIGLGAVFLRLGVEMNFHQLFEAAFGDFDLEVLEIRQNAALKKAGLALN
ncbi:MAG: ABC1 kinase family protein [Alphaproteobacteria bacterium]